MVDIIKKKLNLNYINDTPINNSDDDRFGVNNFALSIAKSIKDIWVLPA